MLNGTRMRIFLSGCVLFVLAGCTGDLVDIGSGANQDMAFSRVDMAQGRRRRDGSNTMAKFSPDIQMDLDAKGCTLDRLPRDFRRRVGHVRQGDGDRAGRHRRELHERDERRSTRRAPAQSQLLLNPLVGSGVGPRRHDAVREHQRSHVPEVARLDSGRSTETVNAAPSSVGGTIVAVIAGHGVDGFRDVDRNQSPHDAAREADVVGAHPRSAGGRQEGADARADRRRQLGARARGRRTRAGFRRPRGQGAARKDEEASEDVGRRRAVAAAGQAARRAARGVGLEVALPRRRGSEAHRQRQRGEPVRPSVGDGRGARRPSSRRAGAAGQEVGRQEVDQHRHRRR